MRQTPGNQAGKQAGGDDNDGQANQSEQPPRNLGFKIQMRQRHVVTGKSIKSGAEEAADVSSTIIEVYIRWIWGLDSALFESFYGMLRKNISPPV